MKKIGILTSGGDAPGMNAVIRTVVRAGTAYGMDVMGIQRGYSGLIDDDMKFMDNASVEDIMQRGGTILKTARCEEFLTEEGRKTALKNLRLHGIDSLIVCGGDGSFHGADLLDGLGMNVMCIPCTIDNDMGYTDYTIGFDTAVGTVIDAVSKIQDTAGSHGRTTIVEVMGRNCGDIALYAGIAAGVECIMIPEVKQDPYDVCKKLVEARDKGKNHSIIIRAEGAAVSTDDIADVIYKETGFEVRKVILSYVQRGGNPSAMDRLRACTMGYEAVRLINEESGSRAIGIRDDRVINVEIKEAANAPAICNLELVELAEFLSR